MAVVGVTGARGVLGRRIAACLAGHGLEIRPLECDVADWEALQRWSKGLDRIVHCAAVVPVALVDSDPCRAAETNVLGTLNVARLAQGSTAIKLAYISSSHVYGRYSRPVAEEDALDPSSVYGLTKLQGEQWVHYLVPRSLTIRVFSFFADDQSEHYLIPSLARRIYQARRHASLEIRDADAVRDIADADWIAEICSKLILSNRTGVVNCGTGIGHTVAELGRRLGDAMGRKDVTWDLHSGSTSGALNKIVADVGRMKSYLGKVPDFDLDSAISKFTIQKGQTLHGK